MRFEWKSGRKFFNFIFSRNEFTRTNYGLLGGSDSKESACNAGYLGLISRSERPPEEGNGYPLQHSCLENSMDRGAWWAIANGVAKGLT